MSNSDGWYDHVTGPILDASATGNVAGQNDTDTNANDSLIPVLPLSMSANPGDIPTTPLASVGLPPWAKTNFVDHTLTDQTSSLRFIEGNGISTASTPCGFIRTHATARGSGPSD